MNQGEQISSNLVAALKELYPTSKLKIQRINSLLFYQSIIFEEMS